MTALLLMLGAPFLGLLAWHVWRDKRGERRNKAGCCYSCGCTLDGRAMPISHDKGGTYLYCDSCAAFHRSVKNAFLLAAWAVLAASLVVMFLQMRSA